MSPELSLNGNQTSNGTSFGWNALGQAVTVGGIGVAYDGLGRMVETASGSTYADFIYSPSGTKLATLYESSLTQALVPLPGGATAAYTSAGLAYIRHLDWLGSSRLATTWSHGIYAKEAYAPFGETYNETSTTDRSFTGQDQDTATGLYDFLYRRQDQSAGRWLSPDPYIGSYDLTDPQSMNRYAYVRNSPLVLMDPVGLQCYDVTQYSSTIEDDGDGNVWFSEGGHTAQQCDGDDSNDEVTSVDEGEGDGGGGGGGGAQNNAVPQDPCANAGRALPPSAYAQAGQAANGHPINFLLDATMGWPKGHYLDAQPLASGTTAQNAAYGNYVFGVYMQGAGLTLSQTLSGANTYAFFRSSYPAGTPMNPNYPSLPSANVANITNGFNAQAAGTACHF